MIQRLTHSGNADIPPSPPNMLVFLSRLFWSARQHLYTVNLPAPWAACCTLPRLHLQALSVADTNVQNADIACMQDTDTGMGYLAYSSENNRVMHISALTPDYTHVTSTYTKLFVNMAREAPAMFKHKGVFLIATSGCTGWEPNKLEVFWTWYVTWAFLISDMSSHIPQYLYCNDMFDQSSLS